jgi:hypothetical protein
MAGTLVLCEVALLLWRYWVHPGEVGIVAALRTGGASVHVADGDLGFWDAVALSEPRGTRVILSAGVEWLLRLTARLGRVETLALLGTETTLTDDDVEAICRMRHLKMLVMSGVRLPKGATIRLSALPRIEELALWSVPLADADLGHLSRFASLKRLSLRDNGLGDEGMSRLGAFVQLESLLVAGAPVTSDTLGRWRTLPKLTCLTLESCGLTDEDVARLKEFPAIRHLGLSKNPVTNNAVKALAELRGLKTLDLSYTPITDVGLKYLKGTKITKLELCGTRVTDRALRELEASSPGLTIETGRIPRP